MDSLQIAVAAYIAEHGSIDADTYQMLSNLYTTEISADTKINAIAGRAKRFNAAVEYHKDQNTKDSGKHADETAIKLMNTVILAIKPLANKLARQCDEIANISTIKMDITAREYDDILDTIKRFDKTLVGIHDNMIKYNEKVKPLV